MTSFLGSLFGRFGVLVWRKWRSEVIRRNPISGFFVETGKSGPVQTGRHPVIGGGGWQSESLLALDLSPIFRDWVPCADLIPSWGGHEMAVIQGQKFSRGRLATSRQGGRQYQRLV
jgi:hypothetical protein